MSNISGTKIYVPKYYQLFTRLANSVYVSDEHSPSTN